MLCTYFYRLEVNAHLDTGQKEFSSSNIRPIDRSVKSKALPCSVTLFRMERIDGTLDGYLHQAFVRREINKTRTKLCFSLILPRVATYIR